MNQEGEHLCILIYVLAQAVLAQVGWVGASTPEFGQQARHGKSALLSFLYATVLVDGLL